MAKPPHTFRRRTPTLRPKNGTRNHFFRTLFWGGKKGSKKGHFLMKFDIFWPFLAFFGLFGGLTLQGGGVKNGHFGGFWPLSGVPPKTPKNPLLRSSTLFYVSSTSFYTPSTVRLHLFYVVYTSSTYLLHTFYTSLHVFYTLLWLSRLTENENHITNN
jgi:hypothetical protein